DLLPLGPLVEAVNKQMAQRLKAEKKEQISRLTGQVPASGASFDPGQPLPPPLTIQQPPAPPGGVASLPQIKNILSDISIPPVKITFSEVGLKPESMPPFPARALAEYKDDDADTDFRKEVVKYKKKLVDQILASQKVLKEGYDVPADENKFKQRLFD